MLKRKGLFLGMALLGLIVATGFVACLTGCNAAGTVATDQQQLAAAQGMKNAATQQASDMQAKIDKLTQTTADLQSQLTTAQATAAAQAAAGAQPNAALQAQIDGLTKQLADANAQKATATTQKAAATQAAANADPVISQATTDLTNATNKLNSLVNGLTTTQTVATGAAGLAGMVPGYGTIISLVLGGIGTAAGAWAASVNKTKTAQAEDIATSIVQSIEAAKASGHLVIPAQVSAILNQVQTPEAKAFVDSVQKLAA